VSDPVTREDYDEIVASLVTECIDILHEMIRSPETSDEMRLGAASLIAKYADLPPIQPLTNQPLCT
jgi:hypothetical protein